MIYFAVAQLLLLVLYFHVIFSVYKSDVELRVQRDRIAALELHNAQQLAELEAFQRSIGNGY
jgi:hypothetical protein